MKDPRTTGVAIIAAVILLIMIIALVLHKVDLQTFTAVLASVGAFCGVLVGLFAGDSKNNQPPATPPSGQ